MCSCCFRCLVRDLGVGSVFSLPASWSPAPLFYYRTDIPFYYRNSKGSPIVRDFFM